MEYETFGELYKVGEQMDFDFYTLGMDREKFREKFVEALNSGQEVLQMFRDSQEGPFDDLYRPLCATG